jgi:hypothetical protein
LGLAVGWGGIGIGPPPPPKARREAEAREPNGFGAGLPHPHGSGGRPTFATTVAAFDDEGSVEIAPPRTAAPHNAAMAINFMNPLF